MIPVDGNLPIQVTLSAEQWNGVLHLMGEAPVAYRLSAPLIQAIGGQIQAAAAAAPALNGADRAIYQPPPQ